MFLYIKLEEEVKSLEFFTNSSSLKWVGEDFKNIFRFLMTKKLLLNYWLSMKEQTLISYFIIMIKLTIQLIYCFSARVTLYELLKWASKNNMAFGSLFQTLKLYLN